MGARLGIHFEPTTDLPGMGLFRYHEQDRDYITVDMGDLLAITDEEKKTLQYEAPIWFDITSDSRYDTALPYNIRVHTRDDLNGPRVKDCDCDCDDDEYDGDSDDEDYNGDGDDKNENERINTVGGVVYGKVNAPMGRISQIPPHLRHTWRGPIMAYAIKDFTVGSSPKRLDNMIADVNQGLNHLMNIVNRIKDLVEMVSCVRITSHM